MIFFRKVSMRFALGPLFIATLCAFQQPFKQYPGIEHFTYPLPPDF